LKYLLFAGAPNTGKTESILELAKHIRDVFGYKEVKNTIPEKGDFHCVLEKLNKKVLIQSDTDLISCVRKLKRFYDDNKDVNLIITSVRDIVDSMRYRLEREMNMSEEDTIVEIPLGKVRRGNNREECISWYTNNIQKIAQRIIRFEPFNL
jgi:vacuolar-type H+-ATPase subunit F/Vma7